MYIKEQLLFQKASLLFLALLFVNNIVGQEAYESVVDQLERQMIWVEGGTFLMGQNNVNYTDNPNKAIAKVQGEIPDDDSPHFDELPAHTVTVEGFFISSYETTQKLWQTVMGTNPSFFPGEDQPVENVSWEMVQVFLNKLNNIYHTHYRLPTEAEWEFASRGGNLSKGYRYSGSDDVEDVAWYSNDSLTQPKPVGMKFPNELGLYDMSGNIFEWVNDWYGKYQSTAQVNPQGPSKGTFHVLRGGCWKHSSNGMRVSFRTSIPTTHLNKCGFRLARSADNATFVTSVNVTTPISRIEYYTLNGVRVALPSANHLYIKVVYNADGSVRREKIY